MMIGLCAIIGVLLSGFSTRAAAARFSDLVIFGDSLSDSGNFFAATRTKAPFPIPPSAPCPMHGPYFHGRFSNGPNYADCLAITLGLSATPACLGGQNFAVGGARTNGHAFSQFATRFSLLAQVQSFLQQSPVADPAALYIVFAGANDLQDAIAAMLRRPSTKPGLMLVQAAVNNISQAMQQLAAAGAVHFFVPNAADLALLPRISQLKSEQISDLATTLVGRFNARLERALQHLERQLDVHIIRFDTCTFLTGVVDNGNAFGFKDVRSPCYRGDDRSFLNLGTVHTDPALSLFWDTVHPTELGHATLARAFAQAILSEPRTLSARHAEDSGIFAAPRYANHVGARL